jgi:predicted kinase
VILYVFSGLPGTGKTTLSQRLAAELGAVHLRIDTIEQALRDLCGIDVQGEGYRLAYRLAADNLRLGASVVADSCNPIELTRREWHAVAVECGVRAVDIEVVCSNPVAHRARVESRTATVAGLRLPTWQDVVQRQYDPWTQDRNRDRHRRQARRRLLGRIASPTGLLSSRPQ